MTIIVQTKLDSLDLGASWATTGGASITTDEKREGTGSLTYTLIDDSQGNHGYWNDAGNAHFVNFGDTFFHRFWMKFSPTFEWRAPAFKAKTNRWGSSGGAEGSPLTGYIGIGSVLPGEHNQGFTSDQGAGSGGEGPGIGYDFNPATNAAIQGWQQYIVAYGVHSAENATDGFMRLYVNQELIGQLTGVRWWTTRPNANTYFEQWGVFCMSNFFAQDADGQVWIDDVMLATTLAEVQQDLGVVATRLRGSMSMR